jgi:hypothetical protein
MVNALAPDVLTLISQLLPWLHLDHADPTDQNHIPDNQSTRATGSAHTPQTPLQEESFRVLNIGSFEFGFDYIVIPLNQVLGYDSETLTFGFILNGLGHLIQCQLEDEDSALLFQNMAKRCDLTVLGTHFSRGWVGDRTLKIRRSSVLRYVEI